MKTRIIEPDFVKGVCIILMIYGHITHIGAKLEIQNSIVEFIYTFHMPLFLIVSGLFFKISSNPSQQVYNLFRGLVIPYVFFITIYLLGLIIVNNLGIQTSNRPPSNLLSFIKHVFLYPIGGYWFIHSLVILNLTMVIINWVLYKRNNLFILLVIWLVMLTFFVRLDLIETRTVIYFLSGYVLGIITDKKIIIPVSLALLFMFLGYAIYMLNPYGFSIVEFVWCSIILGVIWSISSKFHKTYCIKLISWVGQNTLVILVMHALFIISFKSIVSIFLNIDETGIAYSLFTTIFTTLLSLLTARFLDVLGISKILFNKNKIYVQFDYPY